MHNYNEPQINAPVYCINLKRAKERKDYITEEWINKRGVPVTFFEGIDCEDIDEPNYHQIPEPFRQNLIDSHKNDYQRISLGFKNKLSIGEICCSISHCLLLKKLIDLGINEAIIIEDDAEPLFENITELYRKINKLKINMDGINVMLLHKRDTVFFDEGVPFYEDRDSFRVPINLVYCTQCIYYTRQGMIDCYEQASKLIVPMDWTWLFGFLEKRQIGLTKDPICEHNIMTTYVDSRNKCRLYMSKNKDPLDERFKNFRKKHNQESYPFYNEGLFLEEYFYNFYQKNKNKFDETNYKYLPIFWTNSYLLHRPNSAQRIFELDESLQNLEKINPSQNYFTVSQHDDAPRELIPKNTILFAAGGNVKNSIPIPLICETQIKNEAAYERDIFCSFVGSITHPCRDRMHKILSEKKDYKIITKEWSYQISDKQKNLFIITTKRSKYTLCPRGYGPTSWRLYEAMQLGSVPVYIYDEPYLPYKANIDWQKICVMIHINDIQNIDEILKSIPDHVYNEMITNIQKIYPLYFNLEYMCEFILNHLKTTNNLQNKNMNENFIDTTYSKMDLHNININENIVNIINTNVGLHNININENIEMTRSSSVVSHGDTGIDPQIDAFIFNWRGQLQKTLKTESELCKIFNKVTVINSDDDNKFDHWINIGEDAYFAAQFLKALELFDGDILFHVQGDVTYDNWSALVENAKLYYKKYKYGVYAPNVCHNYWDSEKVDLDSFGEIDNEKLKLVSMTDCSCWFINKEIVNEYKLNYCENFKKNKYGFGADLINCGISLKKNMPVLRDYEHAVDHPCFTGYNWRDANRMLEEYINAIEDKELKFLVWKIRNVEINEIRDYLKFVKYKEIINNYDKGDTNKNNLTKLKKMRIYSVYSESHEVFKPWFESIYNIYPEIDIKYSLLDQSCQSGEFQNHGWNDVTLNKLKKILEIFDDESNNDDYFIFSDIDIQFFKPFHQEIENLLQNNDIVFQNDYASGPCTGFFACRKTNIMKQFFNRALEIFHKDDQVTVHRTLKEFPNIKFDLLPKKFFTYGMFDNGQWNSPENNIIDFKIPSDIVCHHANWTVGIHNKLKLLNFVKDNYKNQRFCDMNILS